VRSAVDRVDGGAQSNQLHGCCARAGVLARGTTASSMAQQVTRRIHGAPGSRRGAHPAVVPTLLFSAHMSPEAVMDWTFERIV